MACAPGLLPAPPPIAAESGDAETAQCVPVVDRRESALVPSEPQQPQGHFATGSQVGASRQGVTPQGDPIPQGIADAGTFYLQGQLQVTYSATFRSYVEVYPDYTADEFDALSVDGYYMTATNRTEKGVEFLFRFRESQGNPEFEKGWFMIFDWSCLPAWPCQNEAGEFKYGSSFVRDWRLDEVPCWYTMLEDNTGHYVNYAYYRNSTFIVDPGNPPGDPPLWRNAVSIWNYCTGQYDGVYTHDYAVNQADCAATGTCGGWAGIAERFPDTTSKPTVIAKQGFHHQTLDYDGLSTRLKSWNSTFTDPSGGSAPWNLYYLSSNDTWEAGTYQDDDGDDVPNSSDPDIDADGVLNGDEIACGATAPPGYTADAHPYRRPERIDGQFANVDDDGDTLVDEALPGGVGSSDCDGDGYSGATEDHVYSYKSQATGDQKTCQEYDTSFPDPIQTNQPSLRWPADLNSTGDSLNKIDVLDLTSFLAPVKYRDTDVGTHPGDVRWDLVPGPVPGVFDFDINMTDLTSLLVLKPPMLGGIKAFGGPPCPWPP